MLPIEIQEIQNFSSSLGKTIQQYQLDLTNRSNQAITELFVNLHFEETNEDLVYYVTADNASIVLQTVAQDMKKRWF